MFRLALSRSSPRLEPVELRNASIMSSINCRFGSGRSSFCSSSCNRSTLGSFWACSANPESCSCSSSTRSNRSESAMLRSMSSPSRWSALPISRALRSNARLALAPSIVNSANSSMGSCKASLASTPSSSRLSQGALRSSPTPSSNA